MKKVLLIILPLFLLTAIGLFNRQVITEKVNAVVYQSPCDTPREYLIGSVDERFSLSDDEYRIAIEEAAAIWEKAYGKKLFVENPEKGIVMNLIYDTRQSLKKEIAQRNDALKQKDTVLKPEIAEHERKVADLRRRIEAFEREVEAWNEQGGAPSDVYAKLKDQQVQLKQESDALNAEATALSLETEQFKTEVSEFNEKVSSYNEALDLKPEGGHYVRDENGEKIDIYIYSTRQELINILAHEMGHALGIEHVANAQAIMYEQTNGVITVAKDDVVALQNACQKENMIKKKFRDISYSFNEFIDTNILKK
jgi:hypothetical protein